MTRSPATSSVDGTSPKGFTPAQVATLKAEGFVETGDGWTLTINERLLFARALLASFRSERSAFDGIEARPQCCAAMAVDADAVKRYIAERVG